MMTPVRFRFPSYEDATKAVLAFNKSHPNALILLPPSSELTVEVPEPMLLSFLAVGLEYLGPSQFEDQVFSRANVDRAQPIPAGPSVEGLLGTDISETRRPLTDEEAARAEYARVVGGPFSDRLEVLRGFEKAPTLTREQRYLATTLLVTDSNVEVRRSAVTVQGVG